MNGIGEFNRVVVVLELSTGSIGRGWGNGAGRRDRYWRKRRRGEMDREGERE